MSVDNVRVIERAWLAYRDRQIFQVRKYKSSINTEWKYRFWNRFYLLVRMMIIAIYFCSVFLLLKHVFLMPKQQKEGFSERRTSLVTKWYVSEQPLWVKLRLAGETFPPKVVFKVALKEMAIDIYTNTEYRFQSSDSESISTSERESSRAINREFSCMLLEWTKRN